MQTFLTYARILHSLPTHANEQKKADRDKGLPEKLRVQGQGELERQIIFVGSSKGVFINPSYSIINRTVEDYM